MVISCGEKKGYQAGSESKFPDSKTGAFSFKIICFLRLHGKYWEDLGTGFPAPCKEAGKN